MDFMELAAHLPGLESAIFCHDSTYAKPTTGWLLEKFYPWFRDTRAAKGLGVYGRKNDCDDYARAFCVYARESHSESAQADESLAVGEFCYRRGTGNHCIVVAVTEAGRIFIEPQSGQQLTPTAEEIASAFRITF